MSDLVYALVGLVILLVGGDMMVRGAVALSLRMGIPPLLVGLSVVAFGTSAPELLIGVKAALRGAPDIAVGNVVGSNIANILLVLGVPALISTLPARENGITRSYVQMVLASVLLIVLCWFGPLHYWHAAVLLTGFAWLMMDMVRSARAHPEDSELDVSGLAGHLKPPKMVATLALGLIGLPLGAHLLIEGSVGIARDFGIPEAVIGLTMVAIGTSLPELATSVMAALRKQADVAMGNVLGSNLFNILSILGVTSLFGPIPINELFLHRELWVMLGCAVALGWFVLGRHTIGRFWGCVFLAVYAAYMVVLFHHGGGMA